MEMLYEVSDSNEEVKTELEHETDSLKLSIASSQMNKLAFNEAELEVISRVKQPVLLRKKLIYQSLKDLQPELMTLFNGTEWPAKKSPANFEIQRKFMCRICAFLAIDPKLCACGSVICRSCC